jgi:hypothetical protein
VNPLGALEARYSDDHVPLALVLGAKSALTAVRCLLPAEPCHDSPPNPEQRAPDPFVLLLLGVIATHDRLLSLFGPAFDAHMAGRPSRTRDEGTDALEGLLR